MKKKDNNELNYAFTYAEREVNKLFFFTITSLSNIGDVQQQICTRDLNTLVTRRPVFMFALSLKGEKGKSKKTNKQL